MFLLSGSCTRRDFTSQEHQTRSHQSTRNIEPTIQAFLLLTFVACLPTALADCDNFGPISFNGNRVTFTALNTPTEHRVSAIVDCSEVVSAPILRQTSPIAATHPDAP